MGRHSAPDDDEEPAGTVAVEATAEPEAGAERRGRHYRGEDVEETGPVPGAAIRQAAERAAAQDERPTQRIDLAAIEAAGEAPPVPVEDAEPVGAPGAETPDPAGPPAKTPRAAQSTSADLALIRHHADVRNRVLGAALAPFVLYAIVLLVLGARGVQYLLWIWIPTVTAGVLIGFVLDAGHKRHRPRRGAGDQPA
jgi:hypothetical protein